MLDVFHKHFDNVSLIFIRFTSWFVLCARSVIATTRFSNVDMFGLLVTDAQTQCDLVLELSKSAINHHVFGSNGGKRCHVGRKWTYCKNKKNVYVQKFHEVAVKRGAQEALLMQASRGGRCPRRTPTLASTLTQNRPKTHEDSGRAVFEFYFLILFLRTAVKHDFVRKCGDHKFHPGTES